MRMKKVLSVISAMAMAALFTATAFPAGAEEAGGIYNYDEYRIRNVGTSKYLNVHLGIDANGTNVYQWTYDSSKEQRFRLCYDAANDCYRIRPIISEDGWSGRVLDITRNGGPVVAGSNVKIWDANDPPSQQFLFVSNGSWSTGQKCRIVPKSNQGTALAAYGTGNGTAGGTSSTSMGNVYLANIAENDNQYWVLESVFSSKPFSTGKYYIRNRYSNKYLDVEWAQGNAGDNVCQFQFNGNTNQQWWLVNQNSNFYTLAPMINPNLRLDLYEGGDRNGQNIEIYNDTRSPAQQFQFIPSGFFNNQQFYRINPKTSVTRVLDVCGPSTSNNANIQLWTYGRVAQHHWSIERVETDNYSREIIEMPMTYSYRKAVSESAAEYDSMSVAEELLLKDNMAGDVIAATAGVAATANMYPNASRMLKHFLENTGASYTLPSDFISNTSEIDDMRKTMSNNARAEAKYLATGDFTVTFGQKIPDEQGDTAGITDWKLAVNRCELWTKVYCYSKTSSSVYLHVRDFYDWTGGNTYGVFNVAASSLERLHRAGWAREYPVYGYGLVG